MAKPGEDLEKVVEIIERSIAPDARVERNVFLPILSSTQGHKAQCDLVIRTGVPPRETLTIVEVQDRTSQVDIGTYRGWVEKLNDVGGQHLICVSRRDFASSIKEKVSQSGSKVFLVTLKELDPDKIPLDLIRFTFQYRHINITAVKKLKIYSTQSQGESLGLRPDLFTIDEKFLSHDGIEKFSLIDACKQKVQKDLAEWDKEGFFEGEGETLFFGINNNPAIYFEYNNKTIQIGLSCEFNWSYEHADIPMSTASYEQDQHGTLAWVFEAEYKSRSGIISLKIPALKTDDGNYKIPDPIITAPFDAQVEMPEPSRK